MRIAVVGSEGYLGSCVVKDLLERDHEVLRIDIGLHGQPLPPEVVRAGTSPDQWRALREWGAEGIADMAAVAHDPDQRIPEDVLHQYNSIRPVDLATAAAEHKIRYVTMSSLSIFADSLYSQSKRALEYGLTGIAGWQNYISIFRAGTLFGPAGLPTSFRPHLLLNSMLWGAVKDRTIRVTNPGVRRGVTPVAWVAQTVVSALTDGSEMGSIFTCLHRDETLQRFAQMAANEATDFFDEPVRVVRGKAQKHPLSYGWRGTVAIEHWLEATLEWLQEHRSVIRKVEKRFPREMYRRLGVS